MAALSPGALWAAAFESPSSSRPVANASFAVNHYLHGGDVTGYHVVNLACHVLAALLVFAVARRTLDLAARRPENGWIAFMAALWFVAHPVQTQSVTYVVQRMTSMSAAFYLLALWLWLVARPRAPSGARTALFAGAGLAWALSLGSKQIAATLPALLLLYEVYFFRDLRIRGRQVAVAALLFVAIGLVYLGGDPARILDSYAGRDFGVGERLLTQPRVIVFYLSLVALPLPSRQNLLHDFSVSRGLLDPATTLVCGIAVAGLLVFAVATARRQRLVSFCVLWFLGHLVIESSVVGLEMVFEHRLYLPLLGPALLASAALFRALPQRAALVVGTGIALLLGAGTYARNETWSDRLTLWADVVAKSPGSPRAHNSYGRALEQAGRLDEAGREFETALALRPEHTEAHFNLGVIAWDRGQLERAAFHYTAALRTDPSYVKAHNNLGAVYARQGRARDAIRHFSETVRLNPHHANARFNLAVLLERAGRPGEALEHYEAAARLLPDDPEVRARRDRLRGAVAR